LSCSAISTFPLDGLPSHYSSEPPCRWFALYTVPRHEKQVHRLLLDRQIEAFLPLYRAARRWKKKSPIVLDLPLFPNYVFVRIAPASRGSVLAVSGALSLVGSSREAWPLHDGEIAAMRAGLHLRQPEPHPYLVLGERVRILSGPMSGLEGVLVRKKNSFRVVLTLDKIMCSVSVEVDAAEIEPVASRGQDKRN
jgi:transcription antitermination factor NusG